MKFLNEFFKYKLDTEVVGLTNELNVFYILNYFQTQKESVLILTNTLYEANKYYDAILNYTTDCLLFPMDDFVASVALAISPELKIKRLETINALKEDNPKIVVTNLMGFLRYLPDYRTVNRLEFKLEKGLSINRDKILEVLDSFGYKRDTLVTSTGEYAVRGYVIDLFLIEEEHPIRIEFFGNEIESIRYFDENTQMSIKEIDAINCLPFQEISTSSKSCIYDYMNNPMTFFVNSDDIKLGYEKLCEELLDYKKDNPSLTDGVMFELDKINVKKKISLNKFVADKNKRDTENVPLDEDIDEETILKLNLLLNTNLNGLPIQDINLGMIARLKEQAGIHSGLVARVLDAVAATIHVDEDDMEIYTSGATNFFKYPELSDTTKATGLISTFEEKQQLVDLVKERMADDSTGVQVYIGDELPISTMKDCSVVTATYELGEGMHGTIGIVGPKRMDYENVVNSLKTLKVELDQVFTKNKSNEDG